LGVAHLIWWNVFRELSGAKVEAIVFEEIGHEEVSAYLAEAGFVISPLDAKDKMAHRKVTRV